MPKPSWKKAVTQCAEYRNYLATLDLAVEKKTKAYLITKESLDALLTQNGQTLDGIRVYIGQETEPGGEKLIHLVAVAVEKIVENGQIIYNDYNIPGESEDFDTYLGSDDPLGDERPCPMECSDPNALNSGRTAIL